MNPLLDAAWQYAGRGWRVFPLHSVWHSDAQTAVCTCRRREACPSKGKHPRIAEGFKSATTDRSAIEGWWAKWPDANIGIATGSGLTVMDIDGEKGRAQLEVLLREHSDFPATLACRTGNGGHLYFALAGVKSAAKGNLHVRGEGGYVVAAPSLHWSGRRYEWVNAGTGLAVPPPWLVGWFAAGGENRNAQRGGGDPRAEGQNTVTRSDNNLSNVAAPAPLEALGAAPAWITSRRRDATGEGRSLAVAGVLRVAWTAHEEARLRGALQAVPADDYDTWLRVGFALRGLGWRDGGRDIGLALYHAYSARSPDKYTAQAIEEKWAGFAKGARHTGGVTIASIYRLAAEHGWDGNVSVKSDHVCVNRQGAEKTGVRDTSTRGKVNGQAVAGVNGHSFEFSANAATVGDGGPIFVDLDRKGKPKATCVNARIALGGLGLTCRHDRFHDRLEVGGRILQEWAGELTDNAVHVLRGAMHTQYGFDPGTIAAHDATVQECLADGYDPIADYLDALEWDRKPRLGAWLTTYMQAEDNPLNRAIAALGLIAAVRRVRVPGAKFDAITVLVGGEGQGKSSAVEILAGESNFSDQPILSIDERAQQEAMQGVWLYEIADLAGMSKADVDKVKAFASRRIDRARPAYARSRVDRPRRCVFFGTTNLETFLKSQTGNRRFWPVAVGRVDVEGLVRDRDQLWAEAVAVERAGVPLALPQGLWDEAAAVQMARMETDPWDDILAHLKTGESYETWAPGFKESGMWREHRISTRDILELNLKIPTERQHDGTMKRLAYAMRRLGWDGPKKLRLHGIEEAVRGFTRSV